MCCFAQPPYCRNRNPEKRRRSCHSGGNRCVGGRPRQLRRPSLLQPSNQDVPVPRRLETAVVSKRANIPSAPINPWTSKQCCRPLAINTGVVVHVAGYRFPRKPSPSCWRASIDCARGPPTVRPSGPDAKPPADRRCRFGARGRQSSVTCSPAALRRIGLRRRAAPAVFTEPPAASVRCGRRCPDAARPSLNRHQWNRAGIHRRRIGAEQEGRAVAVPKLRSNPPKPPPRLKPPKPPDRRQSRVHLLRPDAKEAKAHDQEKAVRCMGNPFLESGLSICCRRSS